MNGQYMAVMYATKPKNCVFFEMLNMYMHTYTFFEFFTPHKG